LEQKHICSKQFLVCYGKEGFSMLIYMLEQCSVMGISLPCSSVSPTESLKMDEIYN